MSIKESYTVQSIKPFETHEWLLKKHYARRIPSISYAFGLYDSFGILQGVCTFGTPPSSTLLTGVCGNENSHLVMELNRLVIDDGCPKNMASYLVSKCLKLLPKSIVISYADTGQGHIGVVYQSCNFIYTGLSSKFIDPMVKGLEHQHHATYANGMSNDELRQKYGDKLYFVERSRKHRYVYFVKCSKKIRSALNYPILPYPKGKSERYDASYKPQPQLMLF